MLIILTLLLVSFFITSALYIPFIDLLYKWRVQRQKQKTQDAFNKPTPIFDRFHKNKAGTPVGGGLLIIVVTSILFPLFLFILQKFFVNITTLYDLSVEVGLLLFTFISFGILGLFDDLKKTFTWMPGTFLGLRLRHKLILELAISFAIAFALYSFLGIRFVHIPFIGAPDIGIFFVPFAAFVIVAFSNAYNITDGLDGLASGVLLIALTAFLVISASILDTPLSVFIALWLGGLAGFLYFNVYPARIILGDTGALAFGATFAVIGLILGKTFALVIIGGIFVAEVFTSLMQLLYKKYLNRKFMDVAPLHLWLQLRGWSEPKIVARFWIISIILAILGLWLSYFNR